MLHLRETVNLKTKDEIQEYYADCFVLSKERNYNFILNFLNYFVPHRKEIANEYEIPQYSEIPKKKFRSADETIKFLIENKKVKYTIYFENLENAELKGVELFFTDDEFLVYGIYCNTKFPNTEIENRYFDELKKFCNSNQGYITYEEGSPHNSQKFIENVKKNGN